MPFIDLQSNLPASSFPQDFVQRLSSCAAAALDKPEEMKKYGADKERIKFPMELLQRMNVVVKPGLPMLIGGSSAPCLMLSVSAIAVTDTADKNKEHSSKFFTFLTKELDLAEDRIVIVFHSLQPHQVGKMRTVMSFL